MLWGGGGCAVRSRSIPILPTEALLTPAPDRSVAATLHRRGSSGRGFSPRSSVSLSPPGLVAELVRPGPRWQAYPRVCLAGGWLLMPDVVGCLWAGVTYVGVWAGPTDLPPAAIGTLRSAPPPPLCRKPHMSLCGMCQPAVALGLHAPAGRPLRSRVPIAL